MDLGVGEIVIILVIALLLFGPTKIPQLGDALGKGLRSFKKAISEDEPSAKPGLPPHGPAASPPTTAAPGTKGTGDPASREEIR